MSEQVCCPFGHTALIARPSIRVQYCQVCDEEYNSSVCGGVGN